MEEEVLAALERGERLGPEVWRAMREGLMRPRRDILEAWLKGGSEMEEVREPKLCPYLVGNCRRERCQLWIESLGECGLVVQVMRDEILNEAMQGIEALVEANAELLRREGDLEAALVEVRNRLEASVPREDYNMAVMEAVTRGERIEGLEKELADARKELEAARAKGRKKPRRKKKPVERES